MRKARSRKNIIRFVFYTMFLMCVFVIYDFCFGYTFKGIITNRIERFLPNNMNFEVKHIEGGVFRDVISRDISVYHPGLEKPFTIDRVEIPYRFWYSIITKHKEFIEKYGETLKVFFTDSNPFIEGYFLFERYSDRIKVMGDFSLLGKITDNIIRGQAVFKGHSVYDIAMKINKDINITGLLDVNGKKLELLSSSGNKKADLNVFLQNEDTLIIKSEMNHMKINGIDIIGSFSAKVKSGKKAVELDFRADDMIINYHPFNRILRIRARYMKNRDVIDIYDIALIRKEPATGKEAYDIKGNARLYTGEEKYIDISAVFNDLQIKDYLLSEYLDGIAEGKINGKMEVRGAVKKPRTDIHLSVTDGRIEDFEFVSLTASMLGEGNILDVKDGRIIKDDGNLFISGYIDTSLLREGKALDFVKIETDQRIAVWEGWEVSKWVQNSRVRAEKKLGKNDFTFSFETFTNEGIHEEYGYGRENEIGVEYKLDKNESLNMKMKDNENFLGMEHKVKF